MERRKFITGAAAAAATMAVTGSQTASSQSKVEWKMVTSLPVGYPSVGVSADRFAERVTKMSGGRLSIKVYGGGQLVPAFGTQEAVENGVAEIYHGSGSWFSGRDLAHNFFGVIPFGPDVREFNAWLRHGGGQELWDEFTNPRGLKCFAGGGSGVQTAGWYKEPINSLADLKGKNFRITGLGAKVFSKIGANPVALPPGE
ncbi:MAG: twin-arginine translocation signal domain-containing protein, partial [Oceanospirillaceae bacterium]|nr:twin-arginine translocation signal domain-containing protein [Oceanospirillaceae bacterium]